MQNDFVVEAGIPHKVEGRGRKPVAEFPFDEMRIGDSFLIPCDLSKKTIDLWRRRVFEAKKKFPLGKFQTAVVADGLRVWRTE